MSLSNEIILDSSMVEHSAVNRVVVGSSPTRGADLIKTEVKVRKRALEKRKRHGRALRLRGQAVKTSPFHGGNTGSIPVGVIAFNAYCISWMHTIEYGDLAKW